MPKCTNTKKKGPKLTFYKAPHINTPNVDGVVRHRYTLFEATTSRGLSSKSSLLKTIPEETEAENVAAEIPEHDTLMDSALYEALQQGIESDTVFDIAYIEHLNKTGSDGMFRRTRAQGVRIFIIFKSRLIPRPNYRTKLCGTSSDTQTCSSRK